MLLRVAVFLSLVALSLAAQPGVQTPRLEPFEMIWNAEGPFQADVSFLLDAPAGKNGFVKVLNGHLADGAGKRLRIWGVNFSFTASFPEKEFAPAVAAHLARFGVNCARIHHHDWRTPGGLIDASFPDSRHLSPDMLDRFDFFVSELKKRGIYVDLNLNVARAFQAGDGVKDTDQLGFGKAVTLFDPRMIELQKEFASLYLTHKNPYTGNEYRNEPGVALVELVNENSLIEYWARGRLQGDPPKTGQDPTWRDIPDSYARDLDALYQKYLASSVKTADVEAIRKEAGVATSQPLPRLAPAQFKAASALRFRTEAAFYVGLEDQFYQSMSSFLKNELKVQVPVIANSAHASTFTSYPLVSASSKLDAVDTHVYWQHPSYTRDANGKTTGFEIRNTPMVNEPEKSTIVTLHRSAVLGKPFTVSEVNHPYPNEYAAEMIPVLASYASFLDWDAIFWYSFEHSPALNWNSRYPGHFDIRQDPVKMSQLAAGALVFQRGDVAASRKTVSRTLAQASVLDSIREPASGAPLFTAGAQPGAFLQDDVRIASFDAPKTSNLPSAKAPYRTNTKEIVWSMDKGQGLVTVSSPRYESAAGFTINTPVRLKHLNLSLDNPFASVMLVSLDSKPISESTKLLLTTGARTANTGMKWNQARTSLVETGSGPMLIEPVTGAIRLSNMGKSTRLEIVPLDGAGRAMGPFETAEKILDGYRVVLRKHTTPWYVIRVWR
ncbi:MAG TPA: hypothetical protein PKJ41_03660 [Bryobacteraceae bacterium]|nr:hypothetical protein [Bryobacteraceae bacterium]HPT25664.1 hypothetical protein [Bryobacteraceae bacterium]